ncbi:MAG TPA: FAD-dependent oxidoreductase [Acidobacteriaceae bacterium]|jgi:2-polyprenyl-6-methoxyphenol hydroxylase-like FAD-dependent oxidoreductase|nr:FAD-dependent oxidoreductase [Acidobacteriaceae bacterium]
MSDTAPNTANKTTCCIVGGGPAGMVLGLLLARAGVRVTVLEKHKDFFRDFRGDTIHPATLELLHELGLLEEFLQLPHQKIDHFSGVIGGQLFTIADTTHLPTQAKFVALMPQWDFLNFLAKQGAKYPNFDLRMEHNVTGLIEENGRVVGARAETPNGPVEIRATLTVGCDGRHAITVPSAHLQVIEKGVPIDVLWLRLSRRQGDPENALGYINFGSMMVLINRGDYFQCAYIIRKGTFETTVQPAGLDAFRASIARVAPPIAGRVQEIASWDQVKLLTVQINHLERWHRPGLLCIGDAAHAMSPVGGVGINLAIQDAVAAARILGGPLAWGNVTEEMLAAVQQRREFPTRVTQGVQARVHGFLGGYLGKDEPLTPPLALRIVTKIPGFQRFMARLIGLGARPEHII